MMGPRKKVQQSKLIALMALSVFSAAPVFSQQQHGFNFVAAFNQAQEKRIEADKKLLTKMEDFADILMSFQRKHGHFPEPGTEQDGITSFAQSKLLLPSPYSMTGVQSAAEKSKPCALRYFTDPTLNRSRIKEWQKKTPDDWKAEPGCISVINSEKVLLLWGAGADHQPLYDSKNNRYMFAWRILQ